MAPVPGWFKIPCWVMAALLGLSVALQYNDPDPVRWMIMYGAGMVVSIVLPMKRDAAKVGLLVALVALTWSAVLIVGIWGKVDVSDVFLKMSEKGGAVEEEREAGGLLLEGGWLAIGCWFRLRRA